MCLLAKNEKAWSHFWPKVGGKNRNYLFYPSAKSRRELKIKTLGVTFRGASAYYIQKSIAPQKQAVCRFSDDFFFWRNFSSKNFAQKIFRRRKMKCWESSETHFPKVWGRTEPYSRGKRPFKVRHFLLVFGVEKWNVGSSETRFPKVSSRVEPSSRGKRPFENHAP